MANWWSCIKLVKLINRSRLFAYSTHLTISLKCKVQKILPKRHLRFWTSYYCIYICNRWSLYHVHDFGCRRYLPRPFIQNIGKKSHQRIQSMQLGWRLSTESREETARFYEQNIYNLNRQTDRCIVRCKSNAPENNEPINYAALKQCTKWNAKTICYIKCALNPI